MNAVHASANLIKQKRQPDAPNLPNQSLSGLQKGNYSADGLNSRGEVEENNNIKLSSEKNRENIRASNEYKNKLIAWENFQSFLTILHVGNSIVIYEITYNNENGKMDGDINLQLYVSTFSCLLLIAMLVIRYLLELKWLKAKKFIHKAETLQTTGMIKPMIFELIITTIGPQIFLKDVEYHEYVYDYDVTIIHPVNNLLCCFVWIKLYVIIRTILLTNKFTTPRAQRVCLLNGWFADLTFSFRAKFKESPNAILITSFFLSGVICAYMLRIFERPLSEISGHRFDQFWTSVWWIFVTMTTVGYGDVFPKSYGGRLIGAFLCLWGVLLVSLFVVTISDFLEFNHSEKNSYVLIKRLVYREELRKIASIFIASMYKLKLITRHLSKRMSGNPQLDSRSDQATLHSTDFKFRRSLLEFRKKANEK